MINPKNKWRRYNTPLGICINEKCETVISKYLVPNYQGQIQLIFTSPPFPLNRAKKYGNLNGDEYKKWLCDVVKSMLPLLTEDGSIVIGDRRKFCVIDEPRQYENLRLRQE